MIEIKEYVDGLFRNQHLTPEVKDLKEEILSNMLAFLLSTFRRNCSLHSSLHTFHA